MGINSQRYTLAMPLTAKKLILQKKLCQVFVQRVTKCMTECLTCVNTGTASRIGVFSTNLRHSAPCRVRQRSTAGVKPLLT